MASSGQAGWGDFRGTPRFRVLRRLGEGGAGIVYEAFDKEQGIAVALKTLQTFAAEELLRFKNEFRSLQGIEHPNLVSLGELFEHDGRWFFTMEYVEGVDFLAYVRSGVPDPSGSRTPPTFLQPQQAKRVEPETVPRGLRASRPPPTPSAPPPAPSASAPSASGQRAIAPAGGAPSSLHFDETRLRAVLPQLARGLAALHAAGKIHRDIKPSNVLVTPEGRVVILDFGLVTEVGRPDGVTKVNHVVGTAQYMAPEQAAGEKAQPPADWYSVGVMLYRALTGRPAFTGRESEVLVAKQYLEPPPPRALSPAVPKDLDELCSALLHTEPKDRPDARKVLAWLGAASLPDDDRTPAALLRPRQVALVGREVELGALRACFERTREGKAVTVYLAGESGVGKSTLAREFAERMSRERAAVVLHGRCYERESVPYKAVDGVVDALARWLALAPRGEAMALLPRKAALLPQVFPVLRRVEAIATAPVPLQEPADPLDLRAAVFGALRELLTRLAERRPLVLVIDDLQWSDADSLALLRDVLRPPDAPPLLLVATVRLGSQGAAAGAPHEIFERGVGESVTVNLDRLGADKARELAASIVGDAAGGEAAAAIAREAAGHPMFIDELARHVLASAGDAAPASLRLEEALCARVARLEPDVRQVLELVCVVGAPMEQELAARAAAMDFADLSKRLGLLRSANLVRTTGVRRRDAVEPYHDRVRAAVTGNLDAEAREAWHGRYALALEQSERADPEALVLHWREAGKAHRAARYAEIAAQRATETLAFDRAATLYRLVLELRAPRGEEARGVRRRLAEALANSGRGTEAAPVFLQVADEESPSEALELRRRAAEQYLVSGHIEEGVAVLRRVLDSGQMTMPGSARAAVASLLWSRLKVRLRGLEFRERDAKDVPAAELLRIDVCFTVAKGLGMVDTVRGADFQTRGLLYALNAGEPVRVARALALEVAYQAGEGWRNRRRVDELIELSIAHARRLRAEDDYWVRWAEGTSGFAHFLLGRFRKAYEVLAPVETRAVQGATHNFEINLARRYHFSCLYFLGEIAELSRRLPRLLHECHERGDMHLSTHLRTGVYAIVWLAKDDVAGARKNATEAMTQWSPKGVHVNHYLELYAQVQIDLYAREGEAAYTRVRERWRRLAAAFLLHVQYVRIHMHDMAARSALAAANARVGPEALRLGREALGHVRTLEREEAAWALALAEMSRAGALFVGGDVDGARASLGRAIARFEGEDMALHAAAARRRLGALTPGAAGERLTAAADAFFRAQGIVAPGSITAMLAPGFDPPLRSLPPAPARS